MGRRENIAMIETLREEYSSQFIELGQRKWVKFSTRREMVEFVAIYFTKEYCASLVMQRPTRKEKEKMEIWNQKVEAISSVFEATKEAIYLKCNKHERKKNCFLLKKVLKRSDEVTFDLKQSAKVWQQVLKMGKEPILETVFPKSEKIVIRLSKNSVCKVTARC